MNPTPSAVAEVSKAPREVAYQGVEMREFNRVHLHRGEQPIWGDGKRVLRVVPPQHGCPNGKAFLFEFPTDYASFFFPEELS